MADICRGVGHCAEAWCGVDVALHPMQGSHHVEQCKLPGCRTVPPCGGDGGMVEPPERAEPIVDGDHHDAYGELLRTIEIGLPSVAHHSEHRMYRDGHLFVNGFVTGHSFVIDLRDPMNPSVAAHFTDVGEFNVETAAPRISHVYTFAMDDWKEMCALPVTVGHFWIRTVPTRNGLVVLDVSDPSEPQEVGYVFMGEGHIPHWRGTGRGR